MGDYKGGIIQSGDVEISVSGAVISQLSPLRQSGVGFHAQYFEAAPLSFGKPFASPLPYPPSVISAEGVNYLATLSQTGGSRFNLEGVSTNHLLPVRQTCSTLRDGETAAVMRLSKPLQVGVASSYYYGGVDSQLNQVQQVTTSALQFDAYIVAQLWPPQQSAAMQSVFPNVINSLLPNITMTGDTFFSLSISGNSRLNMLEHVGTVWLGFAQNIYLDSPITLEVHLQSDLE